MTIEGRLFAEHGSFEARARRHGAGRALAQSAGARYAPVNERGLARDMVFAQGYAALLKYFDQNNTQTGNWMPFFGNDASVQLAVPAIEDVDAYKANVQAWFSYLNELDNHAKRTS